MSVRNIIRTIATVVSLVLLMVCIVVVVVLLTRTGNDVEGNSYNETEDGLVNTAPSDYFTDADNDNLIFINYESLSYGSAKRAVSVEDLPDLLYAGKVDNKNSYIYATELLDALPKTPEEALDFQLLLKNGDEPDSFITYLNDGVTASGSIGFCPGLLPESVLRRYATPSYPVNEFGQTYGSDSYADYLGMSPELVPCEGSDGTVGYCYLTDLHGEPAKNPEEAMAYMQRLEERREEMSKTGEIYVRVIPLYAIDGRTVIGEFGIG